MKSGKSVWLRGLVVLGLVMFAACGSDDDPVTPPPAETTATIGTTGGTIEVVGEIALTIPATALDADVDFTIADAGSDHEAMVSARALGASVYTVGPTGTTFNVPVQLVLHYDEADLDGFPENSIVIYTDDGSGWVALPTTVDEMANTATAEITHLSNFAVTVPAYADPENVYAELRVHRELSGYDGMDIVRADELTARFDAVVDPEPNTPLQAESVSFGEWDLVWNGTDTYRYVDSTNGHFLTLGGDFDIVVVGNADVPSLNIQAEAMSVEPYVTSLDIDEEVPLSGFKLDWAGTAPGTNVTITIDGSGDTEYTTTVPNTGTYTFNSTELAGIDAGPASITLSWVETHPIESTGYATAAMGWLSTSNTNTVVFTAPAVLEDVTVVSTPSLVIPDVGAVVTDIISVPVSGTVDSVRVYLDITHVWTSDMIVKLTSPDGTELRVLFIGEGGEPESNVQGWYPGDFTPKDDLNGFDGESAGGDWTLSAKDYSADYAGLLNEWRVQIFYTP